MTNVAHLHLSGYVNKQNFLLAIVQTKIHRSSIKGLFTVHVWLVCKSDELRTHKPLFLWRLCWACSYSRVCLLCWNVMELPCTRTEVSTILFLQDGATAHTASVSFGKCFRSMLFHCEASSYGLHVLLISMSVSSSSGGALKQKCTPLDHEPSWFQDRNSEANFSDTRKHGEASSGKSASEVGSVCTQCCAIS
jgi:hypothetical protein